MKSEAAKALQAMRKTRVLPCGMCGAEFRAKDKRAKYCSDACRSKASRARNEAEYFDKPCKACGSVMFTNDKRISYCSTVCRRAAEVFRK